MRRNIWRWKSVFIFLLMGMLSLGSTRGRGMVFYFTEDPEVNATEPSGEGGVGGWALQGDWGSFLGTPIAPRYFITAAHVGGSVGQMFEWGGEKYRTIADYADTESDFRIWAVDRSFSNYAALWDTKDEVRRTIRVFGRGYIRGTPVVLETTQGPVTKGWYWLHGGFRKRWGENGVAGIQSADNGPLYLGNREIHSDFLYCEFNANGLAMEAGLANGDSGGGGFIFRNGRWVLAGINAGASGNYNFTDQGSGFSASLFDTGGLYFGFTGDWSLVPDVRLDRPSYFILSRVSDRLEWIRSIIAQPQPESPLVWWASEVAGPYRRIEPNEIDLANGEIRLPFSESPIYIRLQASTEVRITALSVDGALIRIRYSSAE